MRNPEFDWKARTVGLGIIVNLLLSWTVLPVVIPPFRVYALRELMEVLFWQAIGMIGWPIAVFGGLSSLLLQPESTDIGSLVLVFIYPIILILLVLVLGPKRHRPWDLILLHAFLTLSFAAVWYQVLNGYDFNAG